MINENDEVEEKKQKIQNKKKQKIDLFFISIDIKHPMVS